jgi:ribokinase
MDLVATAPTLPRPGETVLGHRFTQVPGGKGANQAIAAVRAGGTTRFIGAIGSDSFGVTLRARLSASNVDTSLLRVVYGASGVALVVVDGSGENAIVVAPGANAALLELTESDLAAIADADVLVCQMEIPMATVCAAVQAARAAGTRVVLNATPARTMPDSLVEAVDLLVVNRVEGAMLADLPATDVDTADIPDPSVIVDSLLELVERAVLTCGAAGAWYGDRDGALVHIPPPVVQVVDTTAAGDAFTAALAVRWAEGRELIDAVRWASAAGAATVGQLGASSALPVRKIIDDLYEKTYSPAQL